MNRARNEEVPKTLLLTSMLSISITVPVSISYAILTTLGLLFNNRCNAGNVETIDGADYFFNLVYKVYIQNNDCSSIVNKQLTQPESVFVLNIITLIASLLCCAAAIALMIMVLSENTALRVPLVAYVYVGICAASLVVDLTFAVHFGMDYSYLTDQLNLSSPGLGMNYETDLLRLGALVLMTICLKGYVAPAINCVLLVLIVIYAIEYQKTLHKEQHSIHKMGALNAYDQPRRPDPWQPEPQMIFRGPQTNPAYIEEVSAQVSAPPPRSPMRERSTADYLRSESWQNARPFSYLEEPRRPATSTKPRGIAAAADPSWRNNSLASTAAHSWRTDARADWQPPPVPAPDYSPQTPRRLKPALKSYM